MPVRAKETQREKELKINIGNLLKQVRLEMGTPPMSPKAVSRELGRSEATYSKIESGENNASEPTWKKLKTIFEFRPEEIKQIETWRKEIRLIRRTKREFR